MAGTLVAVFSDHKQAEQAALALLAARVPFADIALVCKDAGGVTGAPRIEGNAPEKRHEEFLTRALREVTEHDVEQPRSGLGETFPRSITGLVVGVSVGAFVSTLLLVVPGMGHVLAGGPAPLLLAGSCVGAVLGALLGAFATVGIPEKSAHFYHDCVGEGQTLVTVMASRHNHDRIEEILRGQGGHDTRFFAGVVETLQCVES